MKNIRDMKDTKEQKLLKKEWEQLLKSEQRIIQKQVKKGPSFLEEKLAKYVPEKLQGMLDEAFYKAFEVIFQHGTEIIEKTYHKEEEQRQYQVNEYAVNLQKDKKSMRAFQKQAGRTTRKNMAVSAVASVGFGLAGLGLPDIPFFTSLMLKSIYEIALSYGYTYDSEKERLFILKLIEASICRGEKMQELDAQINRFLVHGQEFSETEQEQLKKTAQALSEEMLYLKFIQGTPVVGLAGGCSDILYLNQITAYAALKYRKRFLTVQQQ